MKKNKNSFISAHEDTQKIMKKMDLIEEKIIRTLNNGIKNIIKSFKKKNGILEFIFRILIIVFLFIIINLPFNIITEFIEYIINNKLLINLYKTIIVIVQVLLYILISILILNKYFKLNKQEIKKIKQIILTIALLVPLYIINIVMFIIIIFFIYLLIQKINILGLMLIIIGLSVMLGLITDIINSYIYTNKKVNLLPFVFSLLLIIIGSIIHSNSNFKYFKNDNILFKEMVYEESISTKTKLNFENKNIIIDDNLDDNNIIIKIKYTDYTNISLKHKNNSYSIDITKNKKQLLNLIINDLKENKIYNYNDLLDVNVEIYVNNKTLNLIK